MRQPAAFEHVDTISHNGTVLVFGEEWQPVADEPDGEQQSLGGESVIRRLRYRENGQPCTTSAPATATTNLVHLVFTRAADGATAIFIDGAATKSQTTDERAKKIRAAKVRGSFANWDSHCRLALANELTSDRPWRGEYRLVAIYRRALKPEEIEQNHRVGPPSGA